MSGKKVCFVAPGWCKGISLIVVIFTAYFCSGRLEIPYNFISST